MMNPVKKIKNISADTQLVIAYHAMYATAAVVTVTAVVASTAAVVYGTVKVAELVTDNDN